MVFAFSFVGDAINVGGTDFIIKDLEVGGEAACFDVVHYVVVRGALVWISLGFEGLNDDSGGANVMCQHDVAVAAARFDSEAPHIVGEDGVQCSSVDVELVR